MEKKFSLHKIWFFYTDEWIVENGLGPSAGIFSSQEEAEREKKRLDRESFKKMGSYDLLRDLTGFFENNYKEVENKLIEYFKSQGWDSSIKQHFYGKELTKFYYEVGLPATTTDEQIDKIIEITGASFHKLIEYKEVKEHTYVKMNSWFWDTIVFDKLRADGILEYPGPYLNGEFNEDHYLMNISPTGEKTISFPSPETAINVAIRVFLECMAAFPDNTFLGQAGVEEWSGAPALLTAYLQNCKTIQLQPTVTFSEVASTEEILGLFELLKIRPFTIYNMIAEIDGQSIEDHSDDSSIY